jgi:hypothetical protein
MKKFLILLVLVLAAAACTVTPKFKPNTTVTPPAVGHPPPPSSAQSAVAAEAFTPYEHLGSSNDDGLAPGESFSALSKACLTDAGYPNANGFGMMFAIGDLAGSAQYGRWGYLGVAEAAQKGFSGGGFAGQFVNVNSPGGGTLTAAEQKAVTKCDTIVSKFLSAQMSGTLAGVRALSADIQTDVQRDPSVKAATKAWSACMAQNGYNLTDPLTAIDKAFGLSTTVPKGVVSSPGSTPIVAFGDRVKQTPAQIALAVTDAECTQSSDLGGIYFAVQASYEQQLTDLNQQALNAAVAEYRTGYEKALRTLPR